MRSLLHRFGKRKPGQAAPRTNGFRPRLEALEARAVPAIYLLEDGTMNVIGTSSADQITVDEAEVFTGYQFVSGPWGSMLYPVYETHIQATIADTSGNVLEEESFPIGDVTKLAVLGQSGDDYIVNNTDKPSDLDGGNHDDTIFGGSGRDTIRGGDGDDYLYGRDDQDELHADDISNDSDYLNGGADNDRYVFHERTTYFSDIELRVTDTSGNDTLDFSQFNDNLVVKLFRSDVQTIASRITLDLNSSTAIENVIGTDESDVLIGNGLANVLEGGDGQDSLEGLTGDDTLKGGGGSDTYLFRTDPALGSVYSSTMNLGSDHIFDNASNSMDELFFMDFTRSGISIDLQSTATQSVGTGLSITLHSTTAIREVHGTEMADTILGNTLDNMLFGYGGNDTLHGRNGNDFLAGGDGHDTVSGGNGKDVVEGNAGNDTLYSDESSGDNDGENDDVRGGSGNDSGSDDGWWYWDPF
jgi:Ca2+-binding RTX toxin-like protein